AREEHRLPAADVPRGDPLGAGSAAGDRGRRSGARGPAAAGGPSRTRRARALRRLPGARLGAPRLLRRGGRVRCRIAHRDAGTGAARGDGAGHPGGLDRAPRHALDPRARSGALVVPEEEEDAFAAAVVRLLGDANLRQELGKRGLAYARQWSSAAMARRLAELYGQLRGAPRVLRVARASD